MSLVHSVEIEIERVLGSILSAGSQWIFRAFRSRPVRCYEMKRRGKRKLRSSPGGCIEIGMRCAPGAPGREGSDRESRAQARGRRDATQIRAASTIRLLRFPHSFAYTFLRVLRRRYCVNEYLLCLKKKLDQIDIYVRVALL